MSDEDEIILSELDDEELVQQMFDDLYDGLKEEIEEAVNILLERNWEPYDILTKALVGGMTIVGADFRDGILFVPEVLLAANAMKGGMFILKPLLAETGAPRVGKMVIGTVKGDIHDIGKNLVSMMMEGFHGPQAQPRQRLKPAFLNEPAPPLPAGLFFWRAHPQIKVKGVPMPFNRLALILVVVIAAAAVTVWLARVSQTITATMTIPYSTWPTSATQVIPVKFRKNGNPAMAVIPPMAKTHRPKP